MGYRVPSDHAQVSHWLPYLLAQQLLSQDTEFMLLSLRLCSYQSFFSKNKKSSKQEHISFPPENPKMGQPKKIHMHVSEAQLFRIVWVSSVILRSYRLIIFHILLWRLKQIISSLEVIFVRQCSKCLSVALVSNLLFISPRTIFPQVPALVIKLGNFKIKLMDLTAERGTAKSLSFCCVGLAELKGIKLLFCWEYQIILFQF